MTKTDAHGIVGLLDHILSSTHASTLPTTRTGYPPSTSRLDSAAPQAAAAPTVAARRGRPPGKSSVPTRPKEKVTFRITSTLLASYRDWSWEARSQLSQLVERALAVVQESAVDFVPPPKGFNGATGLYGGEQDIFCFLIDPAGWTDNAFHRRQKPARAPKRHSRHRLPRRSPASPCGPFMVELFTSLDLPGYPSSVRTRLRLSPAWRLPTPAHVERTRFRKQARTPWADSQPKWPHTDFGP